MASDRAPTITSVARTSALFMNASLQNFESW
jgi:hypothetical protein